MHANVGDWLVAEARNDHVHARRGLILTVGDGGSPPFTVRWSDDGHEAIVFPGPDAKVVTTEQLAEMDRVRSAHIAANASHARPGPG